MQVLRAILIAKFMNVSPNPYDVSHVEPLSPSSQQIDSSTRIAWTLSGLGAGVIAGILMASWLWLMFYSFEGTVIEEELYLSGSPMYTVGMSLFGALSGLIYGCLLLHRFIYALLAHIVVGFIVAFVCASGGWDWTQCMLAAGLSQIPVAVVCIQVLSTAGSRQ